MIAMILLLRLIRVRIVVESIIGVHFSLILNNYDNIIR